MNSYATRSAGKQIVQLAVDTYVKNVDGRRTRLFFVACGSWRRASTRRRVGSGTVSKRCSDGGRAIFCRPPGARARSHDFVSVVVCPGVVRESVRLARARSQMYTWPGARRSVCLSLTWINIIRRKKFNLKKESSLISTTAGAVSSIPRRNNKE